MTRLLAAARRRGTLLGAGAAVLAVGLVSAAVPGASGAFTAVVVNTQDTAGTAQHFRCQDAIAADLSQAYLEWPLSDASGSTTAADTSGNGRTGTYVGTTVSDASAPLGCPRDTGGAWRLDGSTTAAYCGTRVTNPQTFTLEATFQTTVKAGKLIGFGASSTGASTQYDRHLYIGSDGTIVFGIYGGTYRTIASTQVVTDGAWHHVAATLSGNGMKLYLDGSLVAANAAFTTAESTTGYWRVGYDSLSTSWPRSSGSGWFTGRLRNVGVYTSELTAQQIADHAAPTFGG